MTLQGWPWQSPRPRTLTACAASLCLVLGLWLFTSGFLSVRTELPDVNSCDDNATGWGPCRVQATFDKAAVIIVDALREDFFFSSGKEANGSHINDLPRLRQLIHNAGPAAVAARFTADVPTITISRLKAWLTGCLPTFLDIGQSFSAVTLGEDNMLSQLAKHGKRTVFMGDDTWMQLAPAGVFTAAHPYPSFNVMDLHTVDDGVWKHLQYYLAHPGQWDVLIAHYLGVDHAGHAHGVNSAAMQSKLAQMDDQVSQVAETLLASAGPGGEHERTVLLVLSDHGQTLGGDHGGSSADEVNTLLAAVHLGEWWRHRHGQTQPWSAQQAIGTHATQTATAMGTATGTDGLTVAGGVPRQPAVHTISQLDLTATFANLMGIPVPFSNIGGVDRVLWQVLAGDRTAPPTMPGQEDLVGGMGAPDRRELQALMLACKQVHGYLQRYAAAAGLPAQPLLHTQQLYEQVLNHTLLLGVVGHQRDLADSSLNSATPAAEGEPAATSQPQREQQSGASNSEATQAQVLQALTACRAFLQAAAALARRKFTGCDVPRMAAGCVLMLLATLLLLGAPFTSLLLARSQPAAAAAQPAAITEQPAASQLTMNGATPRAASDTPCQPPAVQGSLSLLSLLQALCQVHVLGPLAVCVFQSCSLFGLDWMMAEGRVQCACAAACIMALGLSAVLSCRPQHTHWRVQTHTLVRVPRSSTQHTQQRTLRCWGMRTGCWRVLWVVAVTVVGAGSVGLLGVWGLMDRGSTDPHDKAAQSTTLDDLLGLTPPTLDSGRPVRQATGYADNSADTSGMGSEQGGIDAMAWQGMPRAKELLWLVVPLVAMPYITWGLVAALQQMLGSQRVVTLGLQAGPHTGTAAGLHGDGVEVQRGQGGRSAGAVAGQHTAHLLWLACGQYACCSLWWVLQLLGPEYSAQTPQRAAEQVAGVKASPGHALVQLVTYILGRTADGGAGQQAATLLLAVTLVLSVLPAVMQSLQGVRREAVGVLMMAFLLLPVLATTIASGWELLAHGDVCAVASGGMEQHAAARLLGGMCDAWAWTGGVSARLANTPFRLLLPRVVYGLTAWGLVAAVWDSTAARWQQQYTSAGVFQCLLVLWAPVTLLLGRRGPACMLLAATSISCCLTLLHQFAASRLTSPPSSPSSQTPTACSAPTASDVTTTTMQPGASPASTAPTASTATTATAANKPEPQQTAGHSRTSPRSARQSYGSGDHHRMAGAPVESRQSVSQEQDSVSLCIGGALTIHSVSSALFFTTGHFCEFTGLQYASPFIGFDDMQWWISPVLLSLNTFGAMLVSAMAVALVPMMVVGAQRDVVSPQAAQTGASAERTDPDMQPTGTVQSLSTPAVDRNRITCTEIDHVHKQRTAAVAGPDKLRTNSVAWRVAEAQTCCVSGTMHGLSSQTLLMATLQTFLAARCFTTAMLMVCSTVLHDHILVWAIIAPRYVFELFFQLITVMAVAVGWLLCT